MEELSKKEKRELRRKERDAKISQERRMVKIKKISKWLLLAVLVVLLGAGVFYYFRSSQETSGRDFSQGIPILERSHIARPTAVTDYNSNPPTSGKHWSDANAPVPRGVHNEELPDEALVHNLEHGEVWISYHPRVPSSVKEELRQIADGSYRVVLAPRSKNDTDIALAAWGRLDKFNLEGGSLDLTRVGDFIKRYRNKGPELVP
jgi:hypothetical protein